MKRFFLSILLAASPLVAVAADDLKVSQLEQEVRNLQREMSRVSQELAQLRSQQSARTAIDSRSTPPASPRAPSSELWLDASRWQRVKPGMSELQVVELLGAPASMRGTQSERVLFYAMEIGASGFLSGNVTLRNRVVASVTIPTLQ